MEKKKLPPPPPTVPPIDAQPVSNVKWLHRSGLKANDYNPNRVAPPELDLLEISILEDGWTQPIVINPDMTIVDGFHRYTVSARKSLMEKFKGFVPTVMTTPKDHASQMMATIRHNRARGTHAVLEMANIIESMIRNDKLPVEEIMSRLQMEKDEVIRLALRKGIPETELIMDTTFSQAWTPGNKND